MSQIATLQIIPETSVEAIRGAVTPEKAGWFGKSKDVFWETLHAIAPDVLNFDSSGYDVVVLFEFLQEERGLDFNGIDDHPLAKFLSTARASYFAVFEPASAASFAQKLSAANLTEAELTRFANEFSETEDVDAGKPLLDAAQALQRALAQIHEGSLGLLHVG